MKKEFKKKKYIANGGVRCPYCESYSIVVKDKIFDIEITQEVECERCGSSWKEIYRLVDAEEVLNNT